MAEFHSEQECPECHNLLWPSEYCANCREYYDD